MRPRLAEPARLEDLWPLLRAADLGDDQLLRLASAWGPDDPPRARLEQLVQSGVLTAWQARQILAGRPRRLRLGPYRILEQIGGGGGGRVYRAEHVLLKRLVALKVFRRAGKQPELRAELEAAGRLAHPNLVAAYDAARLRGRLVLVMEYVDGIDLERLVRETGPLPGPLACEVVRQAARALAYLHGRGLVHRDVKPANLILQGTEDRGQRSEVGSQESGENPSLALRGCPLTSDLCVKLADLGLACRAGQGGPRLCGTMDYIAPERGLGADVADIRGDLYSLGCSFYHLLTGRVPFPGGSWTGKLLRHRLEVPEPVRALRPEVGEDVGAVVARLMARDPDERFSNPDALLAALDRLRPPDRRPVAPSPPAPVPSSAPPPRRFAGKAKSLLWALLATTLTGGAAGGVARLSLAPPPEGPREQRPGPALLTLSAGGKVVVSGIDRPFSELSEAIAAARDGATLTLHGSCPFRTQPVAWSGKALTLRAAPGARPTVARLDGQEGRWEALLGSDRPLFLEGLTLAGGGESVAPLVSVGQATLHLRNCRLHGPSTGPLIALRTGRLLELDGCRLAARAQGLAVEIGPGRPCRVKASRSTIEVEDPAGAAVLLWSAEEREGARVAVELRDSTLRAGRIVACRSVGGPVELTAPGCRLDFRHVLASFDGYKDARASRRVLRWGGQGNGSLGGELAGW
jgi:serine/threonine-protein kinase